MAEPASGTVGTSVRRKEDRRLLTGAGRYVADLEAPDALHAAFVRSPHAHARIRAVDLAPALALPGVVGAADGATVFASHGTMGRFMWKGAGHANRGAGCAQVQ